MRGLLDSDSPSWLLRGCPPAHGYELELVLSGIKIKSGVFLRAPWPESGSCCPLEKGSRMIPHLS